MRLVLKLDLVFFAVHEEALEHFIEQLHSKCLVVQIGCLADGLFKIP